MGKLFRNLKYITFYDIISVFIFIILVIPASLYKLFLRVTHKRVWLITEEGHYARDNGYYFYKYAVQQNDKIRKYYVIDKKSHDYEKVKDLGNIIQFRSLKHWIYYLSSEYNISSQKNGNPAQALFYVLHVKLNLFNNRVFLQHGIIMNENKYVFYKETKFKYFVCGAKREYEYIRDNFGYEEDSLILSGLARYDSLAEKSTVDNKQILIIPTWRSWLGRETNKLHSDSEFTKSSFYKNWNGLLNDKQFIDFVEKNHLKVKFYLHANMQKFSGAFKPGSKNIELLSTDADIQEKMKESAIMVTDYSSVSMDFAYLKKPLVYFQFDQKEYRENQYGNGYFSYEEDGFGPVTKTIAETAGAIRKSFKSGKFSILKKYSRRAEDYFKADDINVGNNRKTIFDKLASSKDDGFSFTKRLSLLALYFCYIFMFNIYGPIDSSVAVGVLLSFFFIINRRFRDKAISNFKKWNSPMIITLFALLFVWSFLTIIINGSNDIGFIKGLTKSAITVMTGLLLYSFTDYVGCASRAVNYILAAFIAQTLLEWLFFFSPSLSRVFDALRGNEALVVAARYNGYRGLAISKTPYFALSVSYGLAMMLSLSRHNTLFGNRKILKLLSFLLIASGNLFAGRAGAVALLFAPFMVSRQALGAIRLTKKHLSLFFVLIAATIGVICAVSSLPQAKKLNQYAFEVAHNVASGNGLKTGSTNKLLKMFDRSFSAKTLAVGDGRYETEDGGYYMGTDVGYYRKIYYGGIILIILTVIWHLSLFGAGAIKKESLLILLFLLIMEIKGVAVGQNAMVNSVLTIAAIHISGLYESLLGATKGGR